MQKPFLKWAGSKYQCIQQVRAALQLAPMRPGARLLEPFVGSGAVFLNAQDLYGRFRLTDVNRDLVALFQCLQNEGDAFIADARALFTGKYNTSEAYYRKRERFNCLEAGDRERALLFVYLNRHGFNGLCRYNRDGGFNVPFGRYKAPYFPAAEMAAFAAAAPKRRVTFAVEGFESAMDRAKAGDVVYCDPPYDPLTATASFTSYAAGGFGKAEQRRLAEKARELAARGVTVVISNHDTPDTRAWYAGTDLVAFKVRRYISCHGDTRAEAPELLATFRAAEGGR